MAEIVTNMVGNQVLPPDDPDYIDPSSPSADELELAAQQKAADEAAAAAKARPAPGEAARDEHHGTYDAELARIRNERRQAREELEAERKQRVQLQQELAEFRVRQQMQREAINNAEELKRQAERPDPDVDPYGAKMWELEERDRKREAQFQEWNREREAQRQFQIQQQQNLALANEVQGYINNDLAAFKQANPTADYDSAAGFVKDAYVNYWKRLGLNDQEALAVTANTFMATARTAQLRGQSATQAVYELAQTWGWRPGAAPQGGQPRQQVQQNEADRVRRIQNAVKMQGLGGKTPGERTAGENVELITAEQLAEMSDDDYLRLKSDPRQAQLLDKRLMELG